ncbi:hypothetical protein PAXINDRAFT_96683 [Paxillus involutus ATCC 200175]|nr:hypothetical protein PAXINDRAFT_96683 [Paxillus involutus ATCC 200175]
MSFGFFGLGEEARESYWYALRVTACAVRFFFGWVTRNSANRKGYRWGSLLLWLSKPRSWVDLVDVFPLLRFVPSWLSGAGLKKQAAVLGDQLSELDRKPIEIKA